MNLSMNRIKNGTISRKLLNLRGALSLFKKEITRRVNL